MENRSRNNNLLMRGFTLIELLVVIAIIGILVGIVLVSSKAAVDSSKRSSALVTASSILTELVTCLDDGGDINAPLDDSTGGNSICAETGHTANWPSLGNTGWTYSGIVATTIASNYSFTVAHPAGISLPDITCNLATNGCD